MLFSSSELTAKKAQSSKATLSNGYSASSSSLRRRDEVADCITSIAPGQCMHFVSKGEWSMHEMLEEMLRRAGPSDVYITTWTITEDPARRIVVMKQEGLIKSLHCLLDYRIRDRKPAPFQLLQANADVIALAGAKATVVVGESISLCCLSSANYSRNPRFEAGIISANTEDAKFHIDWIKEAIENARQ
jgi:hypothetical protein